MSSSTVSRLDPSTAFFPPPHHNRSIRSSHNLSNTSDGFLIFKVRSSNPERFVVKPTVGFISPKSVTRLQFTLKKTSDSLAEVKKDRFRIAVKKVSADKNIQPLSDDARKVWDQCDGSETVLDADVWCNYGSEVPANATLTYITDEVESLATPATNRATSAAQPTSAPLAVPKEGSVHDTSSKAQGTAAKVTFGEKQQKVSSPAVAPNNGPVSSATAQQQGDSRSVQDALLNAQRLKESIQADITSLKQSEAALREKITQGNSQSDQMAREALELEELRTKVRLTKASLKERNEAVREIESSSALAGSAREGAISALAAVSSTASSGSLNGTVSAAQTPPTSAPRLGAVAPTIHSSSSVSSQNTLYLSTVLLWMIVAYILGILYRLYANNGVPADTLQLLPPEAREVVKSLLQIISPFLM